MARSINEIQAEILNAKNNSTTLNALEVLTPQEKSSLAVNATSKVAIWRLWVWVVAFSQFLQEQYWDAFRTEIEKRIAASRIHTPKWYREKALDFLFGIALVPDTDYYDTSNLTDAQIAAAQIVANAASVRVVQNGYGTLRMKVVQNVGGEYAPVLTAHLEALDVYFNQHIADAGTVVTVTTGNADLLKLKLDIYYNPLLLRADGSRLDGSSANPVITQIKNHLKSIDFENGKLVLTYLTDALQKVEGVVLPVIREAYSKYGTYNYTDIGVQNVGIINEIRVADAGYMKLDESELLINYIPYTE